jgi:hypothetical protein
VSLDLLERRKTVAQQPPPQPVQAWFCSPIQMALYGDYQFPAGSLKLAASLDSTTAGVYVVCCDEGTLSDPMFRVDTPKRTPAQDVLEVRFLTGLKWDEVGELFGVSRRAVHHWVNGEGMRADNILFVREVLSQVQTLRRESSDETRLALLTPTPLGRPLDLLKASRWGDAHLAMRLVPSISVPPSPHPDPTQLHPVHYLGALTDRPMPSSGRAAPGRSRRIPRRRPR